MQPMLGFCVLVVEDEPLLIMLLEELLDELGCTLAASAPTLADGLAEAKQREFDVAILDVHLRGEPVWPLADWLLDAERPVVFASGDTRDIQLRYPSATVLAKPYELNSLAEALKAATARPPDDRGKVNSAGEGE